VNTVICASGAGLPLILLGANRGVGEMSKSTQRHSAEELGKYVVVEDIAEGTFGKVKSELNSDSSRSSLKSSYSGNTYGDWAQSCDEIYFEGDDTPDWYKDPSST
jgi:hypothetical protein